MIVAKKRISPETERRLDELADMLRKVPLARLETVLRKTETLNVRATLSDKTSIQQAAKRYRLTVTEYLVRLHWFAEAIQRKKV